MAPIKKNVLKKAAICSFPAVESAPSVINKNMEKIFKVTLFFLVVVKGGLLVGWL